MDQLTIAGREFQSRLFVGTGKYRSFPEMARCHQASGAEVVTVAVRRGNFTHKTKEAPLGFIDPSKFFIFSPTPPFFTPPATISTARLAPPQRALALVKTDGTC